MIVGHETEQRRRYLWKNGISISENMTYEEIPADHIGSLNLKRYWIDEVHRAYKNRSIINTMRYFG